MATRLAVSSEEYSKQKWMRPVWRVSDCRSKAFNVLHTLKSMVKCIQSIRRQEQDTLEIL